MGGRLAKYMMHDAYAMKVYSYARRSVSLYLDIHAYSA